MIEYLIAFLGTPYVWGGNTPAQGFDCSGLVNEGLRMKGIVKSREDLTANQIKNRVQNIVGAVAIDRKHASRDDLLFFGTPRRGATHVAIAFDNATMLEAGGGDSNTTTVGQANVDKAFVRLRPIDSRRDLFFIVRLPL